MNTELVLALAAGGCAAVVVVQWAVLRAKYLAGLAKQRGRHAQQYQVTGQQLGQARRQIAQLQDELTAARAQIKRYANRAGVAPPAPVAVPELPPSRQAEPPRRGLPIDGFAETQPATATLSGGMNLLMN